MAKNRIYDWVIKHFGEDIVFMKHDVCSKLQGITKKEVNGVESLTVKHSAGVHALDDKDVVRVEETDDYLFRIKHTGDWDILVTEAYCKKKEAEGVLAQDIVGEILESIAEPAPMEAFVDNDQMEALVQKFDSFGNKSDKTEPDTIKSHTVVDKFGVERLNLYIDNDDNEVIDEYLADMKDIPLGIVYTSNTISEVNHNHAVYDGVVEYVESNNDKPIESGVVLSMYAPCPDIAEGCPLIMSIDEKDKAVVGQTPWKNDDVPVCYIMSNTCRGIIFPYLVYSFDQMEALVQNYDRCAAMFREDVDTQGLGNKYDKGVEKSVIDMLKNKIKGNNGFFHVEIEKNDKPEPVINNENCCEGGKMNDKTVSEIMEYWSNNLSEEDIKDAERMNSSIEEAFSDASDNGENCDSDTLSEEHLFRKMAEYIQDNEISSITFYLDEDGTVHCETLLRAVYPAKN